MKRLTLKPSTFVPLSLCALLGLVSYNAKAGNQWFCPSGGTQEGGSYSWGDPSWSAAANCSSPGAWSAGSFGEFQGPNNYTVTVNNDEANFGLLLNSSTANASVTINGAGSGSVDVQPATSLYGGLYAQGIFVAGGQSLTINAPITGTGAIAPTYTASTYGNLYLYGNNTFSGGTVLRSSFFLYYYNNNNSFGTGPININATSMALFLATGGAPITLANNWTNVGGAAGVDFGNAANTPVTCSGVLSLLGNALIIRCNGDSTAGLTWSGPITGTAGLTFQGNSGGTITLSGPNTYSGQTLIPGALSGITLSVSSLNSVVGGTASSSLGHPTTAANGTIGIGGSGFTCTLRYTGAGETTDRVIDMADTTGGATLENDGSGPITFTSPFTASGAGSKTLTLQGSNPGLNTVGGAIVDNSVVNKTAVVKAQAGTWRLSGVNTYSGGTTINGGTLEIAGSIAGGVTDNAGVLQLDSPTALSSGSSAIVSLDGSLPNGSVILNFTGSQAVNALYIGGVAQATGTWGASGANHNSPLFSGSGTLNVLGAPTIVTEPQSVTAWPDAPVTFTVTALGGPTYQWKRNGTDVPGANGSSYNFVAEEANAGTYTVWLTNGIGWTNSTDAVLTVVTTNAYTQIVRGDSPISYWRLDEAGGTVAQDYVGPNNGAYHNALLNQTPGYSTVDSDACVGLQKMPLGQGSFVSVANYNAFNFFTNPSPQFTLEGWAYFTNITGVQRLFSTDQNVQPLGYMFGISGPNQLVFTTSGYQDYYMPPTGSLASPLQANVWYHLVVGCDGSSLHFYVNGQSVGTAFLASSHGGTNGAPMCLGANGDFLSNGAVDNSEQLKGRLDECAIYGTFLGDYEVLQHYNASLPTAPVAQTPIADQPTNYVSLTTTFTENAVGQDLHYQWSKVGSGPVGSDSSTYTVANMLLSDAGSYQVVVSNNGGNTNPPAATLTVLPIPTTASQVGLTNGLVLHLPFDSDYLDISGHKNNGTNVNATTLPTDSPIVGTGYLHYSSTVGGPYNYVTLGKPSDFVFGPSGNFSVAFWVRQSDIYTNLPFFGNATNSTGRNLGFALAPGLTTDTPISPNGAWAWSFFDGTTADYATGVPGSIIGGNWHHLAFVFDRSSSATVYLDGQFVSSVNDSYLGGVDSGAVFNIGQDPTGMFDANASADMDDLGVWRRVLTQLEVSGMYLAGVANSPGVSFAPVVTAIPPTPTTISNIIGATLTYGGGSGSQFVLVGSSNVAAPLSGWTRIHTNAATPGSFTIPAVGSGATPAFYRVKSE